MNNRFATSQFWKAAFFAFLKLDTCVQSWGTTFVWKGGGARGGKNSLGIKTALQCAMVAAMLSAALNIRAASGTWNVDAAGNWSTAGNWTPAAVPGTAAGDTVGLTFDLTATRTVTMDTTSRTVGTLNIGDPGASYFGYTLTNSGGASLTFNNSGSAAKLVQTATTASDVITVPITLSDNLSVSNNSTLTLSGIISGAKTISKTGSGTLTLSGVNTFTGGMTNLQGTVSVATIANANVAQPLGAVSSVTLGSSGQNATLEYTGATSTNNLAFILATNGTGTFQVDNAGTILMRTVAITGGGGLIKTGAGTLTTASAHDTYFGNTTVNAGILRVDFDSDPNTTYYLNGGILVNNSGTFDRPIIVTADGSGFDGMSAHWYSGALSSSGGNYTLNINISSVANNLTMSGTVNPGPGLTLLLDVQKGSVILANSTVFATNTVSLQLESAATNDMNKFNATFGALSGSGTVSDTGGGGGATTVLTLAGTNSATFSGVIENGTKTTALVKTNTGTQTFSGANTYTGGTTISGGTLGLGANNVFADSGALTLNGGMLSTRGYSDTLGALTLQNSSAIKLGTNTSGTITFASATYTGGTLTVSNWSGTGAQSGTADKIFITAAPSATFLTNINFTGYQTGAIRLGTGEIVPSGAAVPSKLAITSVNGGSSPTAGTGFSVVVQAQNVYGTVANVSSNTAVTISLNTGSGTLGGTLTGTITAGTSSVTISGVTYTKAESGVVLTATRTSGDNLTAGNSSSFTVNPGALHHFAFAAIGTQTYASAFNVTITAQDANNNTVTSFTNTVDLSTTASTISPTVSASFSSGARTESVTVTLAGAGKTITATKSGGSETGTSASFTVSKVTLTGTANNTNRVYGAANPNFTASYSGFVNGDTVSVIQSTPSFSTSATSGSSVAGSPYSITVTNGTLSATNYSFSFVSGQLTITPANSALAVSSSANPSPTTSNVTYTATVTAVSPASGTPTGTVQFLADGTALGSPATLSGGIASVSSSSLSHGTHTIAAQYAGDGNFFGSTNSLGTNQVINSQPVATTDQLQRYKNSSVKVRVATLLANDTDPDSDALTFNSVSATSASGGTNVVHGVWISYAPPAGFTNADSFSYIIADSGGLQATGTVSITILVDNTQSQNIGSIDNLGNGSSLIHFSEIPGRTYTVQYTTNLVTPNWQSLGTAAADTFGKIDFTDSPATNSPPRFYRSTYP
jgi:autotransporter-associated beta strand protein